MGRLRFYISHAICLTTLRRELVWNRLDLTVSGHSKCLHHACFKPMIHQDVSEISICEHEYWEWDARLSTEQDALPWRRHVHLANLTLRSQYPSPQMALCLCWDAQEFCPAFASCWEAAIFAPSLWSMLSCLQLRMEVDQSWCRS